MLCRIVLLTLVFAVRMSTGCECKVRDTRSSPELRVMQKHDIVHVRGPEQVSVRRSTGANKQMPVIS